MGTSTTLRNLPRSLVPTDPPGRVGRWPGGLYTRPGRWTKTAAPTLVLRDGMPARHTRRDCHRVDRPPRRTVTTAIPRAAWSRLARHHFGRLHSTELIIIRCELGRRPQRAGVHLLRREGSRSDRLPPRLPLSATTGGSGAAQGHGTTSGVVVAGELLKHLGGTLVPSFLCPAKPQGCFLCCAALMG